MPYTLGEFGKKVKEKFPQYDSVPDAVLGQKVLEKYPVYKDKVIPERTDMGAGAIIGGVVGGIGGEILGGPLVAAGGATAGAALGETAQEEIEKLTGRRAALSPTQISGAGVVSGITESIGGPVLKAAGKVLEPVAKPIGKAVGELFPGVAKTVGKIAEPLLAPLQRRAEKEAFQTTLDAVSSEPKGKALTSAFKAGRGTEKGITKTVGIESSKQDVELAQELKDVVTSKDPIKNINSLGDELTKVEGELGSELASDTTPIVKRSVNDTLRELQNTMPREFKSEATTRNAYNNAIEVAQGIVNKSDPNINGLRNARKLFDQQARKEFPNAFKDGVVDTKTPSGKAIKDVRDSLNDYLYNTAKDGTKIKALIKRESSIYRALDNIAPKAKDLYGKNWFQRLPEPAKRALEIGGGILGYEEIKKYLPVLPF